LIENRYAVLIKIVLWALAPLFLVYGVLYFDRFYLEANYLGILLGAYMLTIVSWGVIGGLFGSHSSLLLIHNAVHIAILSFILFLAVGFYSNCKDSLYYAPDLLWLDRATRAATTAFQWGVFPVGIPFLFGYIPGKILSLTYRWHRKR
jgi:hypothetical protein